MKESEGNEKPTLLRSDPTTESLVQSPALFRLNDLKWEEGSDDLEGVQIALVSEDPKTGAKSMFMKIPANKGLDKQTRYHYHTATTHTYVIDGSVSSMINGKQFTLNTGDYSRAPANWVHADSEGGPATMFVVFDPPQGNSFKVVPVNE